MGRLMTLKNILLTYGMLLIHILEVEKFHLIMLQYSGVFAYEN